MIGENGTPPVLLLSASLLREGSPSGGREASVLGRGVPAALLQERGGGDPREAGDPAGGRG